MSTTAPAAVPTASANEYVLQDHSGKIKVTYYPTAPGPIQAGQEPGPLLSYSGPQGKNLAFRASQVAQQDTPLGQMITVAFTVVPDLGRETFSFFLPVVRMGAGKSENFTTFCVTAKRPGNIVLPGGQIQYVTEPFHGAAKDVILQL